MRSPAGVPRGPTRRIDFHRTKYGPEILIDIAWVHEMPAFLVDRPHWLSFHDVLLVTKGSGWFRLDGHRHSVAPGRVFFTTPGQVRDWSVRNLDGLCLFFPSTFLEEYFNDPLLLERLPYFRVSGPPTALTLSAARAASLRRALVRMRAELRSWRDDSAHLLRARLYEILIDLAREHGRVHRRPPAPPNGVVANYRRLVEASPRMHRVADLARELAVSPGHLNLLCRRHLGVSAKEVLQASLEVAARRLLLFSEQSAGQVATSLGFRDPSYFARFFRRRTGMSPAHFRAREARR